MIGWIYKAENEEDLYLSNDGEWFCSFFNAMFHKTKKGLLERMKWLKSDLNKPTEYAVFKRYKFKPVKVEIMEVSDVKD